MPYRADGYQQAYASGIADSTLYDSNNATGYQRNLPAASVNDEITLFMDYGSSITTINQLRVRWLFNGFEVLPLWEYSTDALSWTACTFTGFSPGVIDAGGVDFTRDQTRTLSGAITARYIRCSLRTNWSAGTTIHCGIFEIEALTSGAVHINEAPASITVFPDTIDFDANTGIQDPTIAADIIVHAGCIARNANVGLPPPTIVVAVTCNPGTIDFNANDELALPPPDVVYSAGGVSTITVHPATIEFDANAGVMTATPQYVGNLYLTVLPRVDDPQWSWMTDVAIATGVETLNGVGLALNDGQWGCLYGVPRTDGNNDIHWKVSKLRDDWTSATDRILSTAETYNAKNWQCRAIARNSHGAMVAVIGTSVINIALLSKDGGESWTPVTTFPVPGQGVGLHTIGDRFVAICGGPRHYISSDSGKTWA